MTSVSRMSAARTLRRWAWLPWLYFAASAVKAVFKAPECVRISHAFGANAERGFGWRFLADQLAAALTGLLRRAVRSDSTPARCAAAISRWRATTVGWRANRRNLGAHRGCLAGRWATKARGQGYPRAHRPLRVGRSSRGPPGSHHRRAPSGATQSAIQSEDRAHALRGFTVFG